MLLASSTPRPLFPSLLPSLPLLSWIRGRGEGQCTLPAAESHPRGPPPCPLTPVVLLHVPEERLFCSRYMTISDEWDIPEKQPFKDLVRGYTPPWLKEAGAAMSSGRGCLWECGSGMQLRLQPIRPILSLALGSFSRGTCVTGSRRQSAGISTASFSRVETVLPYSGTT